MEFVQCLPSKYKFRKGSGKYLHKRLLFRYISSDIMKRPKRGFRIDYSEFGVDTLRGLTDEYLTKKSLQETGYLNVDFALECVDNYYRGDRRMGPLLWTLLVFEMWRKQSSM
jgi:asparagine synthase (glutamine-hydrolysing)